MPSPQTQSAFGHGPGLMASGSFSRRVTAPELTGIAEYAGPDSPSNLLSIGTIGQRLHASASWNNGQSGPLHRNVAFGGREDDGRNSTGANIPSPTGMHEHISDASLSATGGKRTGRARALSDGASDYERNDSDGAPPSVVSDGADTCNKYGRQLGPAAVSPGPPTPTPKSQVFLNVVDNNASTIAWDANKYGYKAQVESGSQSCPDVRRKSSMSQKIVGLMRHSHSPTQEPGPVPKRSRFLEKFTEDTAVDSS